MLLCCAAVFSGFALEDIGCGRKTIAHSWRTPLLVAKCFRRPLGLSAVDEFLAVARSGLLADQALVVSVPTLEKIHSNSAWRSNPACASGPLWGGQTPAAASHRVRLCLEVGISVCRIRMIRYLG